jgi:excinuclease ABC subunit A
MMFVPDVFAPCELCTGSRFDQAVLQVRFMGLSIAQTLDLSIDEALNRFEGFEQIHKRLQTMSDVGLGYLKLGQASSTLSGGELQRIKLAAHLAKKATSFDASAQKTLFVMDEPTTGLHFEDIHQLLSVLQRLVDHGDTLIVVEHDLDVIKCADWVIDLGPEGGQGGGEVVASGTPEQVSMVQNSWTGRFLSDVLS